jgi:hypothetical protein
MSKPQENRLTIDCLTWHPAYFGIMERKGIWGAWGIWYVNVY